MGTEKLYRSNENAVVCGVCGGIGEYCKIDPVIIRLGWVVLSLLSAGAGVLVYIIASVVIPQSSTLNKPKKFKGFSNALLAIVMGALAAFAMGPILGPILF